MQDNKVILDIKAITKRFFGTVALRDVSMSVFEGEVHGVIGENGAGKSTLMNIIAAVLPADEGTIVMNGKNANLKSPKDAQDIGIGFVHQELSLCPHLSVAENIFMGRLPVNKANIIKHKDLFKNTEEQLKLFNINIYPFEKVGNLNVAEQQVIEITKALSLNCKLLILDEPTSSLTENETESLFNIINKIKKKGISILYISHRMSEIMQICDRVTIMRDGTYIDTICTNDPRCSSKNIINMMVGRNIDILYPPKSSEKGEELLRVENLTRKGLFRNISFALYKSELLGFFGLVGAGRTEVMKALCGIEQKDEGNVFIHGKETKINSYKDALNKSIAYVPEDRKTEGLFIRMNIKKNIVAGNLNSVKDGIILNSNKEEAISNSFSKILNIKMSSISQTVKSLSGGNQQKVMIAKCLSISPKIIILDEPTRGIDVGAKAEVHRLLRELCNQGIGVVIISSELPEIIGMCDRVLVMHEGVIRGEVTNEGINEKDIMALASGQ